MASSASRASETSTSTSTSTLNSGPGLGATLSTGKSLVLLQLLSRLLTFILNQSLVRLAPPEVFGTAAIQFDLIYTTILFLSREGIRNALLRSKAGLQLARLPLTLGLAISAIVVSIYLYSSDAITTSQPDFRLALGLYVVSAWLELGVEPMYIRTLRSDPPKLNVRVQAEGGLAVVKAVVTFGSLVVSPTRALLGFALGQVAGDAWLPARYIWEYGLGGLSDGGPTDDDTFGLAMANTRQSVIKHVLTEGDRIVVGRISPLGDQGGYAIAINYGSLIARIVFQPLEETLLLHFSRSLASRTTRHLFTYVVHLSLHLSLFLPLLLPPVLPVVLPLLLPGRYRHTTAPSTLETYLAFYIPLLSLNGILEAFHASSATPAQISRQAKWMFASSLAFGSSLWALTMWRPLGLTTEQYLVLASCTAMIVRIAYASWHVRKHFQHQADSAGPLRWGEVLPHPWTAACAVGGSAILHMARGAQIIPAIVAVGAITLVTLCVLPLLSNTHGRRYMTSDADRWVVEKPRFVEIRRTLLDKR